MTGAQLPAEPVQIATPGDIIGWIEIARLVGIGSLEAHAAFAMSGRHADLRIWLRLWAVFEWQA